MPCDYITYKALASELNKTLSGGKVNKINMPEKDEIRLSIYNGGNFTLLISCNPSAARIHLTEGKKENPYTAPAFCMHLRKHLMGSTLNDVEIFNRDRIFKLTFTGKTELFDIRRFTVFVELMGRYSNIILVDDQGVITDSLVRIGLEAEARRVIMPNVRYVPPEKGGRAEADETDKIRETLLNHPAEKPLDALLNTVNGMSRQTASEVILRSGLTYPYTADKLEKLISEITIFNNIFGSSAYKPCVSAENSDFFVTPYISLAPAHSFTVYPTLNAAADAHNSAVDAKVRRDGRVKDLMVATRRYRERLIKKIGFANEKLNECAHMDEMRIRGELISANIYKIKRGDKSVIVENYYDEMRPLEIALDPSKSPQQNAAACFNKFNKLKRAEKFAHEQKEEYGRELIYIDSVIDALSRADSSDAEGIRHELEELKILKPRVFKRGEKRPAPSVPKCFSLDGFEIFIGTNNILNNEVTFRIGRSFDMWLHVKAHHGSHVLIRKNREDEEIPESVLTAAAEAAAFYSEASSSDKVDVDYTLRRHVRRIKEAGPGMVSYDNYKTLTVTPKNPL